MLRKSADRNGKKVAVVSVKQILKSLAAPGREESGRIEELVNSESREQELTPPVCDGARGSLDFSVGNSAPINCQARAADLPGRDESARNVPTNRIIVPRYAHKPVRRGAFCGAFGDTEGLQQVIAIRGRMVRTLMRGGPGADNYSHSCD